MRIWLDDIREAPEGWTRCFRPEEAIELIKSGEVEEISLDYDLGLLDERGIDWNGEDVLKWIEREVVEQGSSFRLPVIQIHSANPVGRQRLQRALDAIERRAAESETPCEDGGQV
jgi:hypothetical protein